MVNLSRLEEIKDLRTVWPHEALDFTPWLSQDDNIALLADAVGLDITVDETESSVGDFNVDIFASETGTDRKIIIENQLEDTNHDHLGKLITYASGKSADVIIWVVKHAREEHKAAIEWLNYFIGSSECYISVSQIRNKGEINVALYIPDNKQLYRTLLEQKEDIERTAGISLSWYERESESVIMALLLRESRC